MLARVRKVLIHVHTITCQKENTEVSGATSRLRLASFLRLHSAS